MSPRDFGRYDSPDFWPTIDDFNADAVRDTVEQLRHGLTVYYGLGDRWEPSSAMNEASYRRVYNRRRGKTKHPHLVQR